MAKFHYLEQVYVLRSSYIWGARKDNFIKDGVWVFLRFGTFSQPTSKKWCQIAEVNLHTTHVGGTPVNIPRLNKCVGCNNFNILEIRADNLVSAETKNGILWKERVEQMFDYKEAYEQTQDKAFYELASQCNREQTQLLTQLLY